MGLEFVGHFFGILTTVLYFAILGRVLVSWIRVGPGSALLPVLRFVYAITEPVLGPIRKVLPRTGMFDFSPIVALLLLHLIRLAIENFLT